MRAGVGNHLYHGHGNPGAEFNVMITINLGGDGVGGEIAHSLLEGYSNIIPALGCHSSASLVSLGFIIRIDKNGYGVK
jgi:hypothetical protein